VAQVQIDNSEMFVNDNTVPLVVPARLIDGRTMMSLDDIAKLTGMDVIRNDNNLTIFVLEPFAPIENWPEHWPEHVPGSITLRRSDLHRHPSEPPMRFRYAFYGVPSPIFDLVDMDRWGEWWSMAEVYIDEDINQLMRFVQHFNISREDFDAAIGMLRGFYIEWGWDLADEFNELPNADIIFTFDNDLIRYFYRRE